MAAIKVMTFMAILAAGIAYLSYYPYPDDCANMPIAMKSVQGMIRLVYYLCPIAHALGGNYWGPLRWMQIEPWKIDGVSIERKLLAGIEVVFITPDDIDKEARAVMLFYHGGGWAVGTYNMYSVQAATTAKKLRMLVVMPMYRQAPEYPFPTPFEDCLRFTKEFMANAEEFNVDPNKILFMGDSAGGNLALAVALSLGEENERSNEFPDICMMNLVYPVIQMSNFKLPSYVQNTIAPILPPEMMVKFFLTYMGFLNYSNLIEPMLQNLHMAGLDGADVLGRTSESWVPEKYRRRIADSNHGVPEITKAMERTTAKFKKQIQNLAFDARFAPLTAEDAKLKLLPRTRILTCEYDVLRDDGIILYERMKNLGLDVSHRNLQFGSHGLIAMYGFADYDELDREMDIVFQQITEQLAKC